MAASSTWPTAAASTGSFSARYARSSSRRIRSRSSVAAASVNVMAAMVRMATPLRTKLTMRSTSTVVLPVPAPASTKSVASRVVRTSARAAASLIAVASTLAHVDIGRERRRRPFLRIPMDVAALLAEAVELAEHAIGPAASPVGVAGSSEERPGRDAIDDDLGDLAKALEDAVAHVDLERLEPGPLRHHLVAGAHRPVDAEAVAGGEAVERELEAPAPVD